MSQNLPYSLTCSTCSRDSRQRQIHVSDKKDAKNIPGVSQHGRSGASARSWRTATQEAKNWPNIPLQEKFHSVILRGCQKYIRHPVKQPYEISPGKSEMGYFSPPELPPAGRSARSWRTSVPGRSAGGRIRGVRSLRLPRRGLVRQGLSPRGLLCERRRLSEAP